MQRYEIEAAGHRIPVVVFGDGDRCLVCVNAAQQTMGAWGSLARRAAARGGYRVVLFDFPNQGRASTTAGALSLVEQADLLSLLLHEVSPARPVFVIGGSWGALVAATAAARHPSAVSTLVLGSFQVRTNERLRVVAAEAVRLIERAARRELAEHVIKEFGTGLSEVFRQAMRVQFGRLTEEQLVHVKEQCATMASDADLRDVVDLGRVSAETLIVNGSRDPLVDAADVATTAGCFPRAELRVLADVGHFLHLEQEEVTDIYLEFAQRPRADAGTVI